MQFDVLGPLEVVDDDRSLSLGGQKQRTVLAHLILNANHLVTVERLIDALWADAPPESARNTLQTYIKRLRKLVGAERIEHLSSGYLLRADPAEVDLLRFEALVERARGSGGTDVPGTAMRLRDALGLWRGPALDDLAEQPSLRAQISRLQELWIAAIEERIAADLALGQHRELVAELETLIGHHPYRERSWGHLMIALYRSGRQGDALSTYLRAREVLRDELGIEPSSELQHLHAQILRQDPALELGGETLRGYRLLELVGEGAFGAVHRAFQPGIGREVAVKIIHPRLANDPEFIRRFDVEAQLVARLEHPHIVPVYDYWRDPDGAYLVMRYLRGGSLRQMLTRGPLEPDRAVEVIDEVAHALAAAHRQGVIHRDVQPANILFDEDGNTYLSDFGIARELATSRMSAAGTSPGDFAYYLPPEEARGETPTARADTYSLGLVLYECLTGRRAMGDPSSDETAEAGRERIPFGATVRFGLPANAERVIALATADDPGERYPSVLTFATAARQVLHRATPVRDAAEVEPRNPYKGLRAFPEADAGDFFGREALVARLIARLAEDAPARRFLAVVGPSGSGKSSAVHAGLIPRLRRGALPGSDTWFFVEIMPGADPFHELGGGLLQIARDPSPDLAHVLRRDVHGLIESADHILPPDGSELFLVVDQFEELFTHVDGEERRARFLAALAAAVANPRSRVRVVVTLRADFYDRPLIYRGFGELLASRHETVTPLTADELERAIARPAQGVGVEPEPALLAQIVADASDQSGALPLLEYALTELFERRRDGYLTIADYRGMGGISGALADRAESLLSTGGPEAQAAVRQMFLRLVHLDEGIEDLRRRVRHSELKTIEGDGEAIAQAIESFTRRRLLTSDRDPVTREPTVEVAHEALLRCWPRLRGWLDSARDDLHVHRQLAPEAAAWAEADRDPSFVLRGARLERFDAWAGSSSVALNARERDFLDASIAERDAERTADEAQRQRERLLERRSAMRLRALVAVLATAAIVAASLAVVANNQRERAAREARTASARELAAAAVENLDVDPERSILLAIQAVERTRSVDGVVLPEAEEALHRAVTASRIVRWLPVDAPQALDWSSTGIFVALGTGNTGMIDLRDAETGRIVFSFQGPSARITDVAFSPDGSMLATASVDGRLTVWDVSNGNLVARVAGQGAASGASFSADGSTVAGAWRDEGTVRLLDPSTGVVIRTVGHLQGALHTALGPDGSAVAVTRANDSCRAGRSIVVLVDPVGERIVLERTGPGRPCAGLFVLWSPDGRYIAANGANTTKLWDATGKLRFTLAGHTDEVVSGDWSSDASDLRFVSGSVDGTAKVWEINSSGPLPTFSIAAHNMFAVPEVAFSPDDGQVMTNGGWPKRLPVRVWNVSPFGGAEVANLPSGWLADVAFIGDTRKIALSDDRSNLVVWDLDTGTLSERMGPPLVSRAGWVNDPMFDTSVDGSTLAIARSDGTLSLWATATGTPITSVVDPDMQRFALSPSGRFLMLGSARGTVSVVDRSGRETGLLTTPGRFPVDAVQMTPDDRLIAIATVEQVTIWDWRAGSLVTTIPTQTEAVAFDPTGSLIATAGDDHTPEIWDVAAGKLVKQLPTQPRDIYGLAFDPGGSRLAIGSTDGTIRLFDTKSGQIVTLPGTGASIREIAFSRDGSMLAATTTDGLARIWAMDIDELLAIAKQKLTRSLTEEECHQYLHVVTCPTATG